jgi:hypothetical protein
MRTDDQYFQPGDKVMRVALSWQIPGLKVRPDASLDPRTDFGRVLCVSHCCKRPRMAGNRVFFVGIEGRRRPAQGWCAACFRKVDEIKLCVAAVKRKESPVEQPIESTHQPEPDQQP